MRDFDEKGLAAQGKTPMVSSPSKGHLIHCQVFLQIEGVGNQKNPFFAKKVFYGGCMTGRSPLATSSDRAS
jgi:hypothetical protein